MAVFEKIVIANRGEIALRILQGLPGAWTSKTVARSFNRRPQPQARGDWRTSPCALARRQVTESYLNVPAIIAATEVTDAVAVHPGYGFLAENADFAERVEESGFVFIGPQARHHSADGRQGLGHSRP